MPGASWLTGSGSRTRQALAVALVAAFATLAVAPLAADLHDAIGLRVAGPALPVVLVAVDGPLGPAAAVVTAAGARSVVAALPAGHPLLDGVAPEPAGLVADGWGRVRWFRGARLPLPEALGGLARLSVDQLDGGNPAQLAGRDVVLDLADPALGIASLAPGGTAPVDRAALLAVGIGSEAADASLQRMPRGWLVLVAVVGALATAWALGRVRLWLGAALAAGTLVISLALAFPARAAGVELPVEALVGILAVPLLLRLIRTARTALVALDRVTVRLGAHAPDAGQPTGVATRATFLTMLLPDHAVAYWVARPDGAPLRTDVVGDADWPDLEALDGEDLTGPDWAIALISNSGALVGAVGVGRVGGIGPEAPAVLESVAGAALAIADVRAKPPADPFDARLAAIARAVDGALRTSETWRALLEESGLQIGMFEMGGSLLAASGALRSRVPPHAESPLLALLGDLTGLDGYTIAQVLRRVLTNDTPRLVPSLAAGEEVVISRVVHGDRVVGVLVQIHDVNPHRHLDALKSNVILAGSTRLRNTLGLVAGYAEMATATQDPAELAGLMARIRERAFALAAELERSEELARASVGEEPVQPVFLAVAVREACAGLEGERLTLDLPEMESPIAARSGRLIAALGAVIGELVRQGCRVRVHVWPGVEDVRLSVDDDSGGLPENVLQRWLDPGSGSRIGDAVADIQEMGGSIAHSSVPGVGIRLDLSFPLY